MKSLGEGLEIEDPTGRLQIVDPFWTIWVKVGPLLVINGLITPISRVITPVTYL